MHCKGMVIIMIKSMTGFGREQGIVDGYEILVEIRSVNHRYFEFNSRLPRNFGYLDEKLKSLSGERISRGKVEVFVTISKNEGTEAEIEVNLDLARGYVNALRNANEALELNDDLSLTSLMRFPDVFKIQLVQDDEEIIWNAVKQICSTALDKFIDMRETEGQKMYDDISSRLEFIENKTNEIKSIMPQINENYKNRLYSKIKETLADKDVDEQRILTEVAIFSDKTAVDEETVRLHSHISQFRELINSDEPVGRKLDFLVQELNREVNTIGSKAQDLSVTKTVVDLKSEIEKIREQIQNIE